MKGRIKRPEGDPVQKRTLPRVGRIKTGYKTPSGQPRSVDYFLASGKYAQLFHNEFGDKPDTVQIVFLDDDPRNVCSERYEYRDNDGRLFARGDGETFEVWDGEKYQIVTVDDSPNVMRGVEKRCQSSRGWEVILTLSFVIPRVKRVAGVWEFTTKGAASTIPNIRDTFDTIHEMNGFVKGVLFDLSVTFAKSQKPGVKSRYPVVSLVVNESEENMKINKGAMIPINRQLGHGQGEND